VTGCCECGDEPSGSCATELVSYLLNIIAEFRIVTFSDLLNTLQFFVSLQKVCLKELIFLVNSSQVFVVVHN
jgi:hypothetical protein